MRQAAVAGGEIAMASFVPGRPTSARVRYKAGNSPVSDADEAVDAYLMETLTRALPAAGWLSEETRDDLTRLQHDLCWVVDPIDGTRAYCRGDSHWTISIALVQGGRPVIGVVHAPALGEHYSAIRGRGAQRNGQPAFASRRETARGARAAGPGPMVDQLENYTGDLVKTPKLPSLALRLARVAAGDIDVALVSANARDWDIAAADLLIEEAGGALTGLDGFLPTYNLHDPQHGALVSAGRSLHAEVLQGVQDLMRRNGWS
ncbi:3'(2'),5'-bisphosphate nucleotidase CysQ [Camelimonas abortus]|uniref:3'(2'),5'-bisphosphate nucleotidase CysQ n=1 Tax=Camelimonas abortus TaxID=1017184 RepID=A0ABV7LEC0_9HYPH